jgi:hypothetical protein
MSTPDEPDQSVRGRGVTTVAMSRGTVTGGTGSYQGAAGAILAKNLNSAGTRTAVTITYHT